MVRSFRRYDRAIDQNLIRAIKNGRCILFAGAGLSSQATRPSSGLPLPNWKQLLTEMLSWGKAQHIRFWGEVGDIERMIENGNLLMAAQELQDRIPPAELNAFFKQVFQGVQPSPTHRLLPWIKFRAILTTNYDPLLESAYVLENTGAMPYCYTQEDLLHISSPLRTDDFFIFKVHGHISNQSTIVLGSRNYQELLFRTPGYRQFLETLFSVYTVLFVGFGGNDPDLDIMLDRLASIYSRTLEKHYILLPDGRMNNTEKRRLSLDKKIEVIEYGQTESTDHSQVEAFLRELRTMIQVSGLNKANFGYGRGKLKVFLSASHQDFEQIQQLIRWFRANHFAVWSAYDKLSQVDWDDPVTSQAISEALHDADCVVVLYTPVSVTSDVVNSEVQVALSNEASGRTTIIPIVSGSIELPSMFQGRNFLRLSSENQDADFEKLLRWLTEVERQREIQRYSNFETIPESVLEQKVSNLMAKFAGQSLPGYLFGLIDQQITLPTFGMIALEARNGDIAVDILGDGTEPWIVETKSSLRDYRQLIKQLRRYGERFRFSRIWLITAVSLSPEIREKFRFEHILTSSLEDIELIEQLLTES